MPSLDSLPLPILLRLVDDHLTPPLEERTSLDWFRHPERESFFPHADVVALSSVNSALRTALLPTVFRCVDFGTREPASRARSATREKWMSRNGGRVLACVRHVCIFRLFPAHFEWVTKCLEQMTSLVALEYSSSLPFPPAFVESLKHVTTFSKLYFAAGGTESLPHILPLAPKITHFELDALIRAPSPPESLTHCPITVAAARRSRSPWDDSNVPTVKEQSQAFIKGLASFLLGAKDNLEHLLLDAEDLCNLGNVSTPLLAFARILQQQKGSSNWLQCLFDAMVSDDRAYPVFPKLRRLSIKCSELRCLAFRHLLKTSGPSLTHLELISLDPRELQEPKEPLRKLQMLFVLNGLKPIDVPQVFGPTFTCGASLFELRIVGMPLRMFSVDHLRTIVAAVPNLELFLFKGCYSGEALDYLAALAPLQHLRHFTFDHPFTRPRNFPFPDPDGRTIRSERNGDFRIVTVMAGQSVEEVVRGRIKADIAAVKPTYVKHFTAFARQNPSLEELKWICTEKVVWTWTFWRETLDDGSGKTRLRFKQNAAIDYPETGEVMTSSAILALGRRE
ncbi:hypothetical protein JCM6882_000022 [Rhodosporidiobolus microsporus]